MVRVYINKGKNNIKIKYELTLIRKISYVLSILSTILFIIINIKNFSSKKKLNQ